MQEQVSYGFTFIAVTLCALLGPVHGADDDPETTRQVELVELAQDITNDPADEAKANSFVTLARRTQSPDAVEKLHADLTAQNLGASPAGALLKVALIKELLADGKHDDAVALLRQACETINNDRQNTPLSRRLVTGSLTVNLPVFRDEGSALSKLDLLRLIESALDLDVALDWKFYMNYAVLEITEADNLPHARTLLDKLKPVIPPQQEKRWLYNSANLRILAEEFDLAANEIKRLETLCGDSTDDDCDTYMAYVRELNKALERERLRRAGLQFVSSEVDSVVNSALDTNDDAHKPSSGTAAGSQEPEIPASETSAENRTGLDGKLAENACAQSNSFAKCLIIAVCLLPTASVIILVWVKDKKVAVLAVMAILSASSLVACLMLYISSTERRPALVDDIIKLNAASDTVRFGVSIKNPTNTDLEILAIKSGCGCTRVDRPVHMVRAKSTLTVTLEANLKAAGEEKSVNTLVLLKGYAPLIHQAIISAKSD